MSGKQVKWTMKTVRQRCEKSGDCLLWKGSVNGRHGYPYARMNGSQIKSPVRGFVFKTLLKRELPSGWVISAKCGNKICLSPECLVAKTRGEVMRDTYANGVRARDSVARLRVVMACRTTKLSPTKAAEIRASVESDREIAARLGVSVKHIQAIRRGDVWKARPTANASVFDWASSLVEAA